MMDLRDLQLDDARSLLEHGGTPAVFSPDMPPVEYVQKVIDGLCELSLKDPLTGLANRRHFRAVLEREIDVVARSGESALLLMIDIDHFKKINDSHGHMAGDMVIQAVSRSLGACVRPMDTVARYGGEEFAILLPSCSSTYGETVAERIRQTIQALSIAVSPVLKIQLTVSIGGAYAPEWVRSTTALWTERADVELYRAKTEGRNLVRIDPQPVIAVSAEEKNLLFGHLSIGEPAWIESSTGDSTVAPEGQVNR
ncbi:MAG: GGDEF domain-containing protein [Gammaproteobacteria bacterium]|jgi:diguanylate cyclase (GGDEF)-like protein|nr:GGDEF domain-containing protein [Gammaproteobacteria bacterium]MBU0785722.1 GGDEF domain-containing protein [Gammaproteobacteria bacterium]MBU0813766.1 GGDEF domain-containing protein [Gammaproteobacteria bacterium]MBU1788762.1 GGDEF domain-containing protein [Gammaproteobacteria bacterium]